MEKTKKEAGFTPVPENAIIDEKVVKKLAGEAMANVDGMLGVKGSIGDWFKRDDDVTRGITVDMQEGGKVSLCLKVITETGKNIPAVVEAITQNVTDALQNSAGLKVAELNVEVTDTMTREEYHETIDPYAQPGSIPPVMPGPLA